MEHEEYTGELNELTDQISASAELWTTQNWHFEYFKNLKTEILSKHQLLKQDNKQLMKPHNWTTSTVSKYIQ